MSILNRLPPERFVLNVASGFRSLPSRYGTCTLNWVYITGWTTSCWGLLAGMFLPCSLRDPRLSWSAPRSQSVVRGSSGVRHLPVLVHEDAEQWLLPHRRWLSGRAVKIMLVGSSALDVCHQVAGRHDGRSDVCSEFASPPRTFDRQATETGCNAKTRTPGFGQSVAVCIMLFGWYTMYAPLRVAAA